jgi:hypothetical protein
MVAIAIVLNGKVMPGTGIYGKCGVNVCVKSTMFSNEVNGQRVISARASSARTPTRPASPPGPADSSTHVGSNPQFVAARFLPMKGYSRLDYQSNGER